MLKKIIILTFFCLITSFSRAQIISSLFWLEGSIRYGYGASYVANSNISYDSDITISYMNKCTYWGGSLNFVLTPHWSINVDAMTKEARMAWNIKTGGKTQNIHYTKHLKYEFIEAGIGVRYTFDNGLFLETGLKNDFLRAVSVNNVIDIASKIDTTVRPDYVFDEMKADEYRQSLLSVYGGIGLTIIQIFDDRLKVNFGLRASYSVQDFTNDQTDTPIKDGIFNQNPNFDTTHNYPAAVRLFTGMAQVEISYLIGYYGKSSFNRKKFKFR